MAEEEIRLAAVSYLNTRPLIDALERRVIPGYWVVKDVPSRLPILVETGRADLGLLPSGYCIHHPELVIAPGSGIACRGPVRSILLMTEGDARTSRRIAATSSSMSSAALLRVLLEHYFHSDAEVVSADHPTEMLRSGAVDGALLIGDPALQADTGLYRAYDLGEVWFRLTGRPFVFAMWAGLNPELVRKAAPDLVEAMKLGREAIPRLAAEAAPELGLPPDLCEDYLSNFIIHDVGDAEMEGYELFRQMAGKGTA